MAKTKILHIRVSKQECEEIDRNARQAGFRYRSEYMRHTAIDYNPQIDAKITELHRKLLGIRKMTKREVRLLRPP